MSGGTISIKFTWENSLPIFLACIEHGTSEGRRSAEAELRRMAWLADNAFKPLEISIYPMCKLPNGDHTLAECIEEVDYYDVDVRPWGGDPIWESEGELTYQEASTLVEKLEQDFPQASINDLSELL